MKGRVLLFCLLVMALLCGDGALGETRLMLAADLHYIDPVYFEGSTLLEESAALGDGKMPHFSVDWLAALVREALSERPDALILAGDQTFNGEVYSHKAVAEAMDQVRAAGIPVFAIPGNHDINNDHAFHILPDGYRPAHSIPLRLYGKYYARFGLEQAFSRDEVSRSYAVELNETLWLLMLDTGIYEPFAENFGLMEASTQAWMTDLLGEAAAREICVITVTHQSMLPHRENSAVKHMIANWETVSEALIKGGVRLNLSGHLHVQHIAKRDTLFDVATSSLSAWPHYYGLVTVADDGSIAYLARPLRAEFLPEGRLAQSESFFYQVNYDKMLSSLGDSGFTDAQKAQMARFGAHVNTDFYSGVLTPSAVSAARLDDAYALWQADDTSRWSKYLVALLASDGTAMTSLSLPPPGR